MKRYCLMLVRTMGWLTFLSWSSGALGQQSTHRLISENRTGLRSYFHVDQGFNAETGQLQAIDINGDELSLQLQGYGVRTGLGVEVLRFVQFNVYHTMLNLQAHDNPQALHGSRLNGEMKLVFSAPLANLELLGGFSGSAYEYSHGFDSARLMGTGSYFGLGTNYYYSSQVSFHVHVRQETERLRRTGGSSDFRNGEMKLLSVGMGVSIWLMPHRF